MMSDVAKVFGPFQTTAEDIESRNKLITTFYGRMGTDAYPANCPQATLRADTTCSGCGHGFKAGDVVTANLAAES